jgi:hypothetical protein
VRQLHAGAEWDLHEVRYVWQHDGVFVKREYHQASLERTTLRPGSGLIFS